MASSLNGAWLVVLALVAGALPVAVADDQPAGPDPRVVTVPSFTESPGCGGPYGVNGPFATHSGFLGPEEAVLGPWGDFYGRTMAEVHAQMVPVELPGADRPFTLYVHRRVVPALEQVIANLQREAAAGHHYTIRADRTSSYNPVTVPGTRRFSFHTVGAAIDINSDTNQYRPDNVLVTDMPDWFVKAWTDAGWCWGGDWQDVKDAMHFSWRGPFYTAGYRAPAPFAPDTAAAAFRQAITFDTALGKAPAGSVHLVADLDRDGGPDAVRLRAWTPYGHPGVEVAVGRHDYETCLLHDVAGQVPRAGAGYALADWNGDGRPDLWAFEAGGDTVRVEIYRWETGYRLRRVIRPAVASERVVALLPGDYDRNGRADLYVVRAGAPGTVEVWAGPRFTRLLAQASLPASVTADDRIALGDHDADGVPDVYLLGPGALATLQVAWGGRAFAPATPVVTGVGAHPGSTLQIADYDGDGREDLLFFDQDGRVTVYLGGRRAADADLTGWFSESFDRHWQVGEACVPNPGFETEPGFRQIRLADAAGPGAAFAYPNPETGVWTVAALDWSWWHRLSARVVDLEPITGVDGPAYAVLTAGAGTTVELRRVTDGGIQREIPVSSRSDPVDLAVLAYAGGQALAVLFGGEQPGLVVRDSRGLLLSVTDLPGLVPVSVTAIGDVTGDGRPELVVVGNLIEGGAALRTISLDGGIVAGSRTANIRYAIEAAAALPAADGRPDRVAVLLRHLGGKRGAVAVQDAATGERLAFFRVPRVASGAIIGAATASAPVLVVAVRNGRTGLVRVEGRRESGEVLWAGAGSLGFDPADADQIETGSVLILGHRFGDGNVQVTWWDPATGERTG